MGQKQSKDPKEAAEAKRRERIQKEGVLIPPLFAVPSVNLLTPSLYARLYNSNHPSCLEILHQTDSNVRLIQDYMRPGIWLSASAPGQAVVHTIILPTLQQQEQQKDSPKQPGVDGRITLERTFQSFGNHHRLEVVGGTSDPLAAKVRIHCGDAAWVSLLASAEGGGWLAANWSRQFALSKHAPSSRNNSQQNLDLQLGSWVTVGATGKPSSSVTAKSVHAYGLMDYLGATAAVEASFPLVHPDRGTLPQCDFGKSHLRSYFSIDLADGPKDDSSSTASPPLQLSLERHQSAMDGKASHSAIGVSQVFSIDRPHINPLEERAPSVRNSVGWAVRMERRENEADANRNDTKVSLGVAWQMNRALALKSVVDSDNLTTALVVKRWEEPRVLCSLLHRWNWADRSKSGMWGIGLEVEMTPTSKSGGQYPEKLGVFPFAPGQEAPETKAELS